MHVLALQLDIAWEDKAANYARTRALLAAQPPPPGALVVLPEMSFTGFSMNAARTGAGEPAHTEPLFAGLAREFGVHLVAGLVTLASDGRGRNELVHVTPDGAVNCRYRKLHLFSPAREHEHFAPGGELHTFAYAGGLVAPLICYDLRFPEAFRAAVDLGAEMLVVIANWPRAREQHWMTLLQARAIENQAFVIGVNRCGRDPNVDYSGHSLIVAPTGEVLADAGEGEGIARADLDWSAVRDWRQKFRALDDRRLAPRAAERATQPGSLAI